MAARIERYSYRIGVSVSLDIRLFEMLTPEDAKRLLPTKGPAEVVPGRPTYSEAVVDGNDWLIWTIGLPAEGASVEASAGGPGVVALGKGGALSGFELPAPVASAGDASRGWAVRGTPDGEHVLRANVLPRSIRWRNNAHRVADELEVELHVDQLPFPPDGSVIRSILVEMRRGVIDPDSWAAAMSRGELAADGQLLSAPLSYVSDTPDFVGFVDTHRIKMSAGSPTTVTLPCRDFAGVFADILTHNRVIEDDVPVDEAIARFLSTYPAAVGMRVIWVGDTTPPTLGALAPKAKRARVSKKGRVGRPPKDNKTTALDTIADYCTIAAVTPTFRGYDLFLGPARTLDKVSATNVPRMVFGANLEDLELEHKLAQNQTRRVEVHSFDVDTGRMVIGSFPPKPEPKKTGVYVDQSAVDLIQAKIDKGLRDGAPRETLLIWKAERDIAMKGKPLGMPGAATKEAPSALNPSLLFLPPGAAAVDEKPPLVQTVYGIVDKAQLDAMARNIFEEMARQELSGTMTTKELATVEGRAQGVADLLELRAGDPIGIGIAPATEENAGSYIQRLASKTLPDAIDMLVRGGWNRTVAERVAQRVLSADRLMVYRVREITFDWGLDSGTKLEIVFINQIETEEKKKGGNRARVVKAGGSFAELHTAIDADMLAGEITAAEAARLKKQLVDDAITKAAAKAPPKSPGAPKAPSPKALSAPKAGPWGGSPLGGGFSFKF